MTGTQPAPFSYPIIDALTYLIPRHIPRGLRIHDPFAGDGRKLGELCQGLGYKFSGTDLERWQGRYKGVLVGDATKARSYPSEPFALITSPSYNNGINDHFEPKDDSTRNTYRVAAGHALHVNNTGRYSGRHSPRAEQKYWQLHKLAIQHWPEIALINLKDSIRDGKIYPLTSMWAVMLRENGFKVRQVEEVLCPGNRYGANSKLRLDMEFILLAKRKT
jgi:hypothetical protein